MLSFNYLAFSFFFFLCSSISSSHAKAIPLSLSLEKVEQRSTLQFGTQIGPLEKRVDLQFNGGTQAQQNLITNAFNEAIALAQLMVDNLQPQHTAYIRFFGDTDNFDTVRNVYTQVANLANANTVFQVSFPDQPNAQYWAGFQFGNPNRVRIYPVGSAEAGRLLTQMIPATASRTGAGVQIQDLARTSTALIFHEVNYFFRALPQLKLC